MDHRQLKYKIENNMCNKVKSSGRSGNLEKDDPLLERTLPEVSLELGFKG